MTSREGTNNSVHEDAPTPVSKPVEMDDLAPSAATPPETQHQDPSTSSSRVMEVEVAKENQDPNVNTSTIPSATDANPFPSSPSNDITSSATQQEDGGERPLSAIGPATDKPVPAPNAAPTSGPQLIITLLLHTGARHLFIISEKYLKKRNVTVLEDDPINMSVYTLKELIWRDWRDDWDPRPSTPSSIRLIHYGKMLDDKSYLKDGRFSGDAPNVVHMTVKPQDVVDDEDARIAKGGGRDRDGNERSPGCRCVIL